MNKQILLIEDEVQMQEMISNYLENYGYETTAYADPKEALDALFVHKMPFDVIILDLMLPHMDGFDVAKEIRAKLDTPIIISSARGDIGNKIYGYEIGVDDYLAKPYEPRELVLRIEAILRRSSGTNSIEISDFVVNEAALSVSLEEYPIDFTKVEFEIFLFMLKHRGENVSREQIINATSLEYETKARTVDMHISNIRQKIGCDAKEPQYIRSVWGIGYRFIG